ncbi:MAG: thermosome subunit beta [Nitrososphaerota archaeon]
MTLARIQAKEAIQTSKVPSYGLDAILKKGRSRFKDVRRMNIAVVTKVSDALKKMFGPRGMNIMLVNPLGKYIVTNDGLVTLENMEIENPITKLLVEVAKNQEEVNGDGTKTVVVLTGELLKKALPLLDRKMHPTIIMNGYSKAKTKAIEILNHNVSTVTIDDFETLVKIAKTTIGGRLTGETKEHIARLAVFAVMGMVEKREGRIIIDPELVSFRKIAGGSINDSALINGCIIFKEKLHERMPDRIEGARIALIGSSLDPLVYRADQNLKEVTINSTSDFRRLIEFEKEFNRWLVECVKRTGANVLFCKKRMTESLIATFAEANILAFNLVSPEDMERLAMATGAKIIMRIDELESSDLGDAKLVEFRNIAGEKMLFIEGCRNPKIKSVLIRGGTEEVASEVERVFQDITKSLAIVLKNEKVVPGGGAIEMEIANELRAYSQTFQDKEQLAVEAFAEAIEELPLAIATNAGLNKIDSLVKLRSGHHNGQKTLGVDAVNRRICDISSMGLLDSFSVKQNAIKVAAETAIMILGISDLIMVTNPKLVKAERAAEDYEKQRIQGDRIKTAFQTVDELKEVAALDKVLMERLKEEKTSM